MNTLLLRASALAAALACIGGPISVLADPNSAFLDTVREFADPAYVQSDAGLLIYPSTGPVVSPAPAQPQVVYEVYEPQAEPADEQPLYAPYAEPVHVTNRFHAARHQVSVPEQGYAYARPNGSNAWRPTPQTPGIGRR